MKILEGPKEALIDLAWHPVHPIVLSVSMTGLVYIWAKDYTENWSAFALISKSLKKMKSAWREKMNLISCLKLKRLREC